MKNSYLASCLALLCLQAGCWSMTVQDTAGARETSSRVVQDLERTTVSLTAADGATYLDVRRTARCRVVTETRQESVRKVRVRPTWLVHGVAAILVAGAITNLVNIPLSRPDQRAELAAGAAIMTGLAAAMYVPSAILWTTADFAMAPAVQLAVGADKYCYSKPVIGAVVAKWRSSGPVSAVTDSTGRAKCAQAWSTSGGTLFVDGVPAELAEGAAADRLRSVAAD